MRRGVRHGACAIFLFLQGCDRLLEAESDGPNPSVVVAPVPGADLFVDARRMGPADGRVVLLTPGSHVLELRTPDGRLLATRVIEAAPGETLHITLTPAPVTHVANDPAPSPAAAAPPAQPEPPAPEAAEPAAFLDVHTMPWCDVFVDGRHVGQTPLRGLRVAPGRHQVVLEIAAQNIRQTVDVNLREGETLRITRALR